MQSKPGRTWLVHFISFPERNGRYSSQPQASYQSTQFRPFAPDSNIVNDRDEDNDEALALEARIVFLYQNGMLHTGPLEQHAEPARLPAGVSVVMPVFNEAATVQQVLGLVLAQSVVQEVVVVDDASTDRSWELLQEVAKKDPRVILLRQERNQGKGAALARGIDRATAAIVLIQDADLEYDPAEYGRLIQPIINNKADVVYGSRFLGSGEHRVLYFWHSVGNKLLTILSNMATNLNLSDMETCYKVFRREFVQKIKIEETRFGVEPEITAKLSQLGARIYEVPISYYGRTYAEGKKINWRDGFRALWCILKYNFFH